LHFVYLLFVTPPKTAAFCSTSWRDSTHPGTDGPTDRIGNHVLRYPAATRRPLLLEYDAHQELAAARGLS